MRFLDNERTVEPATDLLETALMRVIPERAGIDRIELVHEALARADRPLRQMRYTVHRVRDPQAVPMHRSAFAKPVLHNDAKALALPDPELRPWQTIVETPDRRLAVRPRNQLGGALSGTQLEHLHCRRPESRGPQPSGSAPGMPKGTTAHAAETDAVSAQMEHRHPNGSRRQLRKGGLGG